MHSNDPMHSNDTSEQLRLLSFHAHPDDESSKGAGTVARYSDQGVHCVLVCATGGEEGDILNEDLKDRPEIVENLQEVRRKELADATDIIGFHTVHMLGYRDSGMKDSDANAHPHCFWAAPLEESTARLATLLRQERPHVMMSYAPARGGYEHPDHVRVNDITEPAITLAADPSADIEGEPWQVLKLYFMTWSQARVIAMHAAFEELGKESPFPPEWLEREGNDHLVTTKVGIGPWYQRRRDALKAHATQVDPNSPFWFGLPFEVERDCYPFEDYERIFSHVELIEDDVHEDDLFAGIAHAGVTPGAKISQ